MACVVKPGDYALERSFVRKTEHNAQQIWTRHVSDRFRNDYARGGASVRVGQVRTGSCSTFVKNILSPHDRVKPNQSDERMLPMVHSNPNSAQKKSGPEVPLVSSSQPNGREK